MGGPIFVPPKWSKPAPLGYGNAIDSVGSVASPLLAGFSLASVILVSDDAGNFRWPGAVMLALTIAAATLIGTVQCAYNARQYLWSAADVTSWWPDIENGSQREELLRHEQSKAFHRWEAWARWTRTTYDCGILALLVGLALALPPQHGAGAQESLRWVASGMAFAACAGEVSWIVTEYWRRSLESRRDGRLSLKDGTCIGWRGKMFDPTAQGTPSPEQSYCPICHAVGEHDPSCRYAGLSIAEAQKRYRESQMPRPTIAPPQRSCPVCQMVSRHDPSCRYAGLSIAEAQKRYRESQMPRPTIAPPQRSCPVCQMVSRHDPSCRYAGLSIAEAQRQYRKSAAAGDDQPSNKKFWRLFGRRDSR